MHVNYNINLKNSVIGRVSKLPEGGYVGLVVRILSAPHFCYGQSATSLHLYNSQLDFLLDLDSLIF